MAKWHRPDLNPEDIAKIIREGREENDKKFDSYVEYVGYIVKDNDKILNALGSDYDEEGIPYWKKWLFGDDEEILPNGCLPSGHKFSDNDMCLVCGQYK